MANTHKSEDTTSGVKSYNVPERKGMSVGRIITLIVVVLAVILILNWLF